MDSDITRSVHIEIANIFFNQEQDDSDEISSEHNSAGKQFYIQLDCHQPITDSKSSNLSLSEYNNNECVEAKCTFFLLSKVKWM